jgi:glycerol kinase
MGNNKNSKKYCIGVIDIGTTVIKFILFHLNGAVLSESSQTLRQYYPEYCWVEEDPIEIWEATQGVIRKSISRTGNRDINIQAIGISNQRESTMIWERPSGKPLSPLIVWQDRRTSARCSQLIEEGYRELIKEKTGLIIDPYFSGTKLEWLLGQRSIMEKAKKGEVLFGTVDSWIIYNLTGNHLTDISNASRTMLFNINEAQWDKDLLEIFNVPEETLPEVLPSYGDGIFGYTKKGSVFKRKIPICSVLGDQQAALFGHRCFKKGDIKSTFGTGSFMMMNTGNVKIESKNNLLSTIFYQSDSGEIFYALEASIFNAGSVLQWLKEDICLMDDYKEIEKIAKGSSYSENIYFVPAFTGLGAPFWDPDARGTIIGITRSTNRKDIIRAAVESLAYRTRDVLIAFEKDSGIKLKEMRIDGGVSQSKVFCRVLSDLTGLGIRAFDFKQYTALGVMYAAGLGSGVLDGYQQIGEHSRSRTFAPETDVELRDRLYKNWTRAVSRSREWILDQK